MNYPKPKKYYLLTRYFKFCDQEPLLHETITSFASVAKMCIEDWNKTFKDYTDYTYNISVITIEYEVYIVKTTYTYEKLVEDNTAEELEKEERTKKINEDLAGLQQNP